MIDVRVIRFLFTNFKHQQFNFFYLFAHFGIACISGDWLYIVFQTYIFMRMEIKTQLDDNNNNNNYRVR